MHRVKGRRHHREEVSEPKWIRRRRRKQHAHVDPENCIMTAVESTTKACPNHQLQRH